MIERRTLRTTLAACVLVAVAMPAIAQQQTVATTRPASTQPVRDALRIESRWRFHLGDIPMPVISGQNASYGATKAGNAQGAAAMDFDDTEWPEVDLPHDWAIATPIREEDNLSQGFHARGIGWYRRAFRLDESDRGKHLELQFDGVATHCEVWVNGIVAARNFCGYTSFSVDLTPFARFGDDTNEIVVRVDAVTQEGWWYEGAGLYRHVQLLRRNAVHIATDGVYANPVRGDDGAWTVPVEVTLNSSARVPTAARVETVILDPDGKEVARGSADATIAPFETSVAKMLLAVAEPRLWSVDRPTLYTVRTRVEDSAGNTLDETEQKCGFRTLRFDADKGFFLNDQPLKIKGTCNHQDAAGVGVAVPDALWAWRLKKLKEMGSNAYRCAHNPPAKEFLDAADAVGMLVLDENRLFDTTDEYVRQLQWMVRRDRNHPSVFMWSVFNEEPMQATIAGNEMVRRMRAAVRQLDVTRPVTAAISSEMLSEVGVAHAVDVVGFNYQHWSYDAFHAKFPTLPMMSSEDTSAVMTRGEYTTDKKDKFTLDSYDTQWQPWGRSHHDGWREIDSRPYLAGGFAWTGFDYRGEPQPLEWPATGSSFGIMDQCGFPKSAFFWHQAMYLKDRPILQLIPHWNWSGREGQPIKVMAMTNAASVELRLNDKTIERKPVDPYTMVAWDVSYAPGKLEAIGFDANGKEIARNVVETTGDAVALRLVPDRDAMNGDGEDAQPIAVEAIDAAGHVVPTAKPLAVFKLDGPGVIRGVANGDPICHEPDVATQRTLYNGLAQLIVQTKASGDDAITVTATADGLTPATTTIRVRAAAAPQSIAPAPLASQPLRRWQMSPAGDAKPDPTTRPAGTDMNTWANVEGGRLQPLNGGRFVVLRIVARPHGIFQRQGATIVFNDFVGKASVFIDGRPAGEKTDAARGTFNVPLPPGEGERQISVIVEGVAGEPSGLGGVVMIEPTP